MKRAAAGFTLIEVMIAITLMGVLALICWRALDSVASSDQPAPADAETTAALRVLQQFQRDIEMRADDALMNGAVRPADQPQRLLPPSLASERHPDGSFALEITRSVGSDGCVGSGYAGGARAARCGGPVVRRRTGILGAGAVNGHCGGA